MWPFRKRHLKYHSIEAWIEGENIPVPVTSVNDPVLRDRYCKRYAELRRHLYEKHVRTLPVTERQQIKKGTHPSQSHQFEERAWPFAKELEEQLASRGFHCRVVVGLYHMDRIVLSVDLDSAPREALKELPWLFHGFEVKYAQPVGGTV